MRKVSVSRIKNVIGELCVQSNIILRDDIRLAIEKALNKETKRRAKHILRVLLRNAEIAKRELRPICQDTGMVSVYMEIGQEILLIGGGLEDAVSAGVKEGYKKGRLRKSVVKSPINRVNTGTNAPPVTIIDIVKGNKLKITVAPKGFGSENKGGLVMLKPTESEKEIVDFVVEVVKKAGPDACPPYILGIGLGGTADKTVALAKKALTIPIGKPNPRKHLRRLENNILKKVNSLGIGPMGLGGKTTCLGVRLLEYPTHIAGLPLAVNVGCHATRSATRVI